MNCADGFISSMSFSAMGSKYEPGPGFSCYVFFGEILVRKDQSHTSLKT